MYAVRRRIEGEDWQENKSLAQLRGYVESQRKLLAELRLTPNGRKAASVDLDDDFDSFPD